MQNIWAVKRNLQNRCANIFSKYFFMFHNLQLQSFFARYLRSGILHLQSHATMLLVQNLKLSCQFWLIFLCFIPFQTCVSFLSFFARYLSSILHLQSHVTMFKNLNEVAKLFLCFIPLQMFVSFLSLFARYLRCVNNVTTHNDTSSKT